MKVSSVSQMRALDKSAIEDFGIKPELLMENAGNAAHAALRQESSIRGKRFLVFCGMGNNGGDGCVLARKIHSDGGLVKVFVLDDPGRFKGAAQLNYEIVTRLPIETQRISSIQNLPIEITDYDWIVDAIFGTGLSRDVEDIYRDVIEIINQSGKPVLSIDISSGVNGDTGQVMGVAVKADSTVTFGLPKYGNILYPGARLGGKLYLSHISFPPSIYNSDNLKVEINDPLQFSKLENLKIDGQILAVDDKMINLENPQHFPRESSRRDLLILDINELSEIARKSQQEVESNPVEVLQHTAEKINTTLILKTIHPLIGFPDQRVYINLSGSMGAKLENFWRALDGTIVALSSLKLGLEQAVRQGVFIHGLAGDLAYEQYHQGDVIIQDFQHTLPHALVMLREGLNTEMEKRYTGAQIV